MQVEIHDAGNNQVTWVLVNRGRKVARAPRHFNTVHELQRDYFDAARLMQVARTSVAFIDRRPSSAEPGDEGESELELAELADDEKPAELAG